jgi:hypothetical protein
MIRSTFTALALAAFSLVLLAAGCDGPGRDHVVAPGGSGHLEGVVFFDLNRDGRLTAGEWSLPGVRVGLVTRGSSDTVRTVESGEAGLFVIEDVPSGTYEVVVSGPALGDTLVFSGTDPSPVEVSPGTVRTVAIGVSYPAYSPGQLASLPAGTRVYMEGIALNTPGSAGDGAVHVHDGTRAVRALDVPSFAMGPGDSVRILGHTAVRSGRVVLAAGTGYRIRELPEPAPTEVSAAQAATAGGAGELDAALVRVARLEVLAASTTEGSHLLVAADETGSLRVRVSGSHLAEAGVPSLQPGVRLSATGLLVPRQGDPGWELRTRAGDDLALESGGTVAGLVFYDEDGHGMFDGEAPPMEGIRLQLVREGGGTGAVQTVESDAEGRFVVDDVEIGTYRVEVEPASVPDSLVVRRIEPELLMVPILDTARVEVAISHPSATVEEARLMSEGHTIFVEGIALNATETFGNGTVHLRGAGRAIRALDVPLPSVPRGAVVRVRARTGRDGGQPVLLDAVPLETTGSGSPPPVPLTSGEAAGAAGGERDADLVEVREVTVVSSQSGDGTRTVVVDDGSGELVVSVRLTTVDMTEPEAQNAFAAGRVLTLTGVLVPVEGENRWQLHPRARADVVTVQ